MTALIAPTSVYATGIFWERLWRMSGINFAVLSIIAYLIYGAPPQVGASAETVVAFYQGDRFVSPLIWLVWLLVVSWVLLARSPMSGAGW